MEIWQSTMKWIGFRSLMVKAPWVSGEDFRKKTNPLMKVHNMQIRYQRDMGYSWDMGDSWDVAYSWDMIGNSGVNTASDFNNIILDGCYPNNAHSYPLLSREYSIRIPGLPRSFPTIYNLPQSKTD